MTDPIRAEAVFAGKDSAETSTPIWLVEKGKQPAGLSASQARWVEASGFKGNAKQHALLPGPDGGIAGVLLGMGDWAAGEPSGPSELLLGQLASGNGTGSDVSMRLHELLQSCFTTMDMDRSSRQSFRKVWRTCSWVMLR